MIHYCIYLIKNKVKIFKNAFHGNIYKKKKYQNVLLLMLKLYIFVEPVMQFLRILWWMESSKLFVP